MVIAAGRGSSIVEDEQAGLTAELMTSNLSRLSEDLRNQLLKFRLEYLIEGMSLLTELHFLLLLQTSTCAEEGSLWQRRHKFRARSRHCPSGLGFRR